MHHGDLNKRGIQEGGDMCICIADSLCSTVEHYIKYNFVKQLNSNKIFFKDKIEEPHSIIEV